MSNAAQVVHGGYGIFTSLKVSKTSQSLQRRDLVLAIAHLWWKFGLGDPQGPFQHTCLWFTPHSPGSCFHGCLLFSVKVSFSSQSLHMVTLISFYLYPYSPKNKWNREGGIRKIEYELPTNDPIFRGKPTSFEATVLPLGGIFSSKHQISLVILCKWKADLTWCHMLYKLSVWNDTNVRM